MAERQTREFTWGDWTITVTAEEAQGHWATPVGASALHSDGRREVMGVHAANFESWESAFYAGFEAMKVGLK